MIKVSYLIALYNKEEFIEDCVNSILVERSENIDIQVCIVDDGSTDNSLSVVKRLYSNNPMVKISSFIKNKGKNSAYNRAYEISDGDFFCIIGADDFLVPGRTKLLHDGFDGLVGGVYGGLFIYDQKDRMVVGEITPKVAKYPNILVENSISGGACMFNKESSHRIFPIPENLAFEDWWVSFILLKFFEVKKLDSPVLYYRIHQGNDSGSVCVSYDSVKKDYVRHVDYLNEFENYLDSDSELQYLKKSKALRESFFGGKQLRYLLLKPFDLVWFKTLLFCVFGARFFYFFKNQINKFLG
ncbi:glycosyltransferase family 2 protein [Aestuariirhabdus sp. Z084]|uniref:glycosyltransferase family 2 protein n=1 Tax=Aestuariirhabdus haliotis TaxID=2918751 RepID=UPI0020BDF1BD|nr:glycosyltransferase family 2 protein [Aestuariirhabdus haliotis]MCL6415806.1 glycosyltransferase family 2 protein [Aestuariirhabdus haliotis]